MKKALSMIVFTLLLSIFALPCTAEVYTKAPDDIPAAVPYPCDTEQVVFIMRECAEDEMPLPMAGDKQHVGRVYSLTNGQWYGLLDMEYEPDIRVVASSVVVYCSVTSGFDRITVQVDTLQDGEWKYAGAAQVGAGEVCEIRFQKPLAYMIHYLIPDYPDGSGWYFDSHQPEEDTVLMLMPFQVTLLPTYLLSKRLGIYDTLWALILPDVFSPMGVFLIWEFMKSIPDETMEAAYLETDSNCRVLCSIVLPAVRPGIVTAGVLHFAESWNRIEQPLILLQSEWRYPLSLRLSLLSESTIGIRFAGSVLFMAPAVLLYFLLRDEITESIKFPAGTR